jgi:hypothetical protein
MGPTQLAKRNISEDSVTSAWSLLIDKSTLLHIKKCTQTEAHRVLQDDNWSITLHELEAFIAIIYVHDVSGCRNTVLHSLWSESWGLPLCKKCCISCTSLQFGLLQFHYIFPLHIPATSDCHTLQ